MSQRPTTPGRMPCANSTLPVLLGRRAMSCGDLSRRRGSAQCRASRIKNGFGGLWQHGNFSTGHRNLCTLGAGGGGPQIRRLLCAIRAVHPKFAIAASRSINSKLAVVRDLRRREAYADLSAAQTAWSSLDQTRNGAFHVVDDGPGPAGQLRPRYSPG